MNSTLELPQFKYFKDPCGYGCIVPSNKVCQCCQKSRGYIYQGNFYTLNQASEFCPWCIHSGHAATKFDGSFHDCVIDDNLVLDKENVDIVYTKTPGFSTWQAFKWPVRDGDICRFIGDIDWQEIQTLPQKTIEEFIDRVKSIYSIKSDLELQKFLTSISRAGEHAGYLFQTITSGDYVIYEDWS